MKGKFLSVGHVCLDITPVLPSSRRFQRVDELLQPGRLIQTGAAQVHTGGSVGNTGSALHRLGAPVTLIGKMGDDALGALLRQRLGGTDGMIVDPAGSTSYTVVLAIPGLDRIFLHNPGPNDTFVADDVPEAALREAGLMHYGYPTLMRAMMAGDGAEVRKLFARAGALQVATSLDLAAVDENSDAGRVNWPRMLELTLPMTDIFTPSFEELCFMLDQPRFDRLSAGGGDITDHLSWEEDILPLSEKVMSLGCGLLLLKCGTRGLLVRGAGRERLERVGAKLQLDAALWADALVRQPCFKADIVRSATGAGDVSIAAFLRALSRGLSPEECAALAAAEGACSVTGYDALSGIQPLEILQERIAAGWETMGSSS